MKEDRVLAIIVCYNPDIAALKGAVRALEGQVEHIVLVDNASANIDEIQKLSSQLVNVLPQQNNLGLGAAHNLGIRYAHDHDYNYCLLMDQDSVPQDDMVKNLLQALHVKQQQFHNKVSAVGARFLNVDTGSESFFVRFGKLKFKRQYCSDQDKDGCIEADFLISSGSLMATDIFQYIGHMDEGLFIDHVDTEWFLRAKHRGFKAFGVCNAVMQHGLGEQTHRVKIRRERNVPQHKPFRYYYIFRNSIALYQRRHIDPWWIWNDLQRLGQIAIMFGVLKAPRRQNLKMMWRGIVDGFKGVEGQVEFD